MNFKSIALAIAVLPFLGSLAPAVAAPAASAIPGPACLASVNLRVSPGCMGIVVIINTAVSPDCVDCVPVANCTATGTINDTGSGNIVPFNLMAECASFSVSPAISCTTGGGFALVQLVCSNCDGV